MDLTTPSESSPVTTAPTLNVESIPLQIAAGLERLLRSSYSKVEIVGTHSISALASLLSLEPAHVGHGRANLVLLPAQDDCERLVDALQFFDPTLQVSVLPAFDVDIYSNLYPNRRTISDRLSWLHRAQISTGGEIFVASIEALLQRTLPFDLLAKNTLSFSLQDDIPENFAEQLDQLGYTAAPIVEDVGTYSMRGGILDIYSPAHSQPVRIELFADTIDSIRLFDPVSQRSETKLKSFTVVPAREVLYLAEDRQKIIEAFKASVGERPVEREDYNQLIHSLVQGQYFQGVEFLIPYFYRQATFPIDHFSAPVNLWVLDPVEVARHYDDFVASLKSDYEEDTTLLVRPDYREVYCSYEDLSLPPDSKEVALTKIRIQENIDASEEDPEKVLSYRTTPLIDFSQQAKNLVSNSEALAEFIDKRISEWKDHGLKVFITTPTQNQSQRIRLLLDKTSLKAEIVDEQDYLWSNWFEAQSTHPHLIHILPHKFNESFRLQEEGVVFLRDQDFFGRRRDLRETKRKAEDESRAHALSFGDLKPGDYVVHKTHGIGVYEGLEVMGIQGVDAEFIQIKYKGKDRLYLPVYRVGQVQKYSGPASPKMVDKLGGTGWEKTKTKVKSHLRDVASELLNLYAKRAQIHRPPFSPPDQDFISFESSFPYTETNDQLKAINDVVSDLLREQPMDRLVCGDVGFGKTEVAMRAAFKAVQDGRQVAMIAPTTVLSFQHFETFRKRFKKWPISIRSLNRFVPQGEIRKTLQDLKDGKVDIVIGTHRLLSKDVHFKDLGLMIVDEEQKFGVRHKERLRKIKVNVDTLAMSATPIPRTLNMSLMGIRDLSLINTAPVDRLPTRTFVCKFDRDTIRKAVMSEISRGGQVFFIHNRIQSIYALADELRDFLPDVRLKVAHGQMDERELEKTMLSFFNHEIDLLLCTTIVESGMDIPRANTMFIDNSHQLGLSQLYQLRGRVGRSKERAYCYLLIPNHKRIDSDAQERLKVIQENTALGSGIRIAQYDLELRGAGDILGEAQSGHVNAVGYELYVELLEEALSDAKGETPKEHDVEPEINVRIPALIPDKYIADIRIRLAYYKALSEVKGPEDVDRIEDELRDQFGKPPEQVINLMGLMLIRRYCKDLGVRDLSSGKSTISLTFTDKTPLPTEKVIWLASQPNKKYSVTPDNRLNVRMHEIAWPKIYDELVYLLSLCPKD